MRAMILERPGEPLSPAILPDPRPGPGEVLVRVICCGVCRTDLHIVDGDLAQPDVPLVLGHEIVGRVVEVGAGVAAPTPSRLVGIPWLGGTCGSCDYCGAGAENLCDHPVFTGYQKNGGFAELTIARADYCFPIPEHYDPISAAPLLCAGLIGYRSFRMAGEARRLGLYGFGAAAHLICQAAVFLGREIYAFTKPGDADGQRFARKLGASWAGSSTESPPVALDAAIIFAPVGSLVPTALRAVHKGGAVICAGIHMSEIPAFPYEILWGERVVRSVANLTRQDGVEFLELAARASITPHVERFPLEDANTALDRLRGGTLTGAAVLVLDENG